MLRALLFNACRGKRFLKFFSPVGKIALTCYLSHTFISIIIFYGLGFNLTGRFGYTVVMSIATVIFILQALLSKVWLKYFDYEPMEWFLKKLTHGFKI
jgi:uncharacterized protein